MDFPRLRTRPQSTQTTTVFRGLERRPGAGIGWWQNERNLSADRAPVLSVRKARGSVEEIDGNALNTHRIVASCGGDDLLLLDSVGGLWCNGHDVNLAGLYETPIVYRWDSSHDETQANVVVTPASGSTTDGSAMGGLLSVDDITVEFCYDQAWQEPDPQQDQWLIRSGSDQWYEAATEVTTEGGVTTWTFTDFDITISADNFLTDGFTVTFRFWADTLFQDNPKILRMGAYALIWPNRIWVNAVKLSSGQEMVAFEDYGLMDLQISAMASAVTLTLCDIDGNEMQGVVVSATEPQNQGKWLDTSGDEPVLREWSIAQTMWVTVASTYIKVSGIGLKAPEGEMIRPGDAVQLSVSGLPSGTDDAVLRCLNSSHYIVSTQPDENNDANSTFVVEGLLKDDTYTFASGTVSVQRTVPEMDFVTEAQNRIWGCRYDETAGINEIYASKLGDFRNWEVFQGLSTDSWRASRGTAAPFTGAATLDGHPLFFREESLEKVFPSAAGAHQIATYDLEGVQEGSADSLVVIEDRLFYKSRQGVMVYAGTMPQRISPQFGDWLFSDATGARHGRKYCISMTPSGTGDPSPTRVCAVYDLATGDWHLEDEAWEGRAITWDDRLYYIRDGGIVQMDGGEGCQGVSWWAESQPISHELPEHKWIRFLRLRFRMELGAAVRVYISYDDGPWLRKGSLHGNRLHSQELAIWPIRCDHFRLRLEGCGGCELYSVSYRMERSEGGR
ncbi:MAG: hypothetical protein IKS05_00995 [Oscillospiraceae bacterium]|nr:hypothetical protein [Oscillospiraceae bacterium]